MQSLRAIQRLSAPARSLSRATAIRMSSSDIASGSMGRAWKDREHAAETQYFNKRDAEILHELAKKLKAQTQPSDTLLAQDKDALAAIFAKHDVEPTDALLDEIIKFKFNH
ncbi:hypothetical protein BWQ96_00667 [Gracilariopsis chorda]|uniref:Uncharacterized protein n=1 Tax=Gracilariopsis chorda TaxID=448386 RepID=A0A2V3J6H5_9FLOR|nr:hypothetical protein BWQ96_00667 [Gracilariopsis chorda]|eukprot:PXF49597.1 hypothetical protein BWQ96_00667 [Gracilariopsis chorda]